MGNIFRQAVLTAAFLAASGTAPASHAQGTATPDCATHVSYVADYGITVEHRENQIRGHGRIYYDVGPGDARQRVSIRTELAGQPIEWDGVEERGAGTPGDGVCGYDGMADWLRKAPLVRKFQCFRAGKKGKTLCSDLPDNRPNGIFQPANMDMLHAILTVLPGAEVLGTERLIDVDARCYQARSPGGTARLCVHPEIVLPMRLELIGPEGRVTIAIESYDLTAPSHFDFQPLGDFVGGR